MKITERRQKESKIIEKIFNDEFRSSDFLDKECFKGNRDVQIESILMANLEHSGLIIAILNENKPEAEDEKFAIKYLPEMINKGKMRVIKEKEEERKRIVK